MEPAAVFWDSAQSYVAAWCRAEPVLASLMGARGFDDRLPDISRHAEAETLLRARAFLHEIDRISVAELPNGARIEYRMMRAGVQMAIAEREVLRPRVRQPALHAATLRASLTCLLDSPEGPSERRAVAALGRLRSLPRYLTQAKELLEPTDPLLLEAGNWEARDLECYLRSLLSLGPAWVSSEGLRNSVQAAVTGALAPLEAYRRHLESGVETVQPGSFAIGREHYDYALRVGHMLEETAEDVAAIAEDAAAEAERNLNGQRPSRNVCRVAPLWTPERLVWPYWTEPVRSARGTGQIPMLRRHFALSGLAICPEVQSPGEEDSPSTLDQLDDACLALVDSGLHAFGWTPERGAGMLVQRAGWEKDSAWREVAAVAHAPTRAMTRLMGRRAMRRLSSDLSRRGANGAAAEELRSHLDREGFLPPKLLRDAIFAD